LDILIFTEALYPHGSGAELATYLYAKLLGEKGVNVVVVTNRFYGERETEKKRNLLIYRLPISRGSEVSKYSTLLRTNLLFSTRIDKLLKKTDLVYVPRFWYSSIPLAKTYRKPVIVHLHDYIPICPLSNIYDWRHSRTCDARQSSCVSCICSFELGNRKALSRTLASAVLNSTIGRFWKTCVRMSDAVICVSKAHKDIMMKSDASIGKKIVSIYNPLPEAAYIDIANRGLGYFGGPNCLKGFKVLYDAATEIKKRNRSTEIHATNFFNLSHPFLSRLEENGFTLYGRLNASEFLKLYSRIRCVVVPSIWPETFSYAAVEALLHGRLVVASNIGALPEVTSGCSGVFLFTPQNSAQLADALIHVESLNRENVIDMGISDRETLMRKFDNEKTIHQFLELCTKTSENN